MKWIKLNRYKIKVFGKESKLPLKISGRDDTIFLHNLLTNDIKGLKPFYFNYNLRLTGSGEPINDFFVYREEDFYIIDTDRNPENLINELEKMKLSLKVFFEPLEYQHIFVFGESSTDFLKTEMENFTFKKENGFYTGKNPVRIGEEGYDIFGDTSQIEKILPAEKKITREEFEEIRIKNCIPAIEKELRKGFHPLEANINYAFSFEKGCYIGQEAIARVYFRGRTPRTLINFETEGHIQENEKIFHENKPVGVITSTAGRYGLGYILKNLAQPGKIFNTENGKIKILKECIYSF